MGTINPQWKARYLANTPITPPTPTMDILLDDRPGFASKEAVASWAIASTAASALLSTQAAKMRMSLISPPVSPMSNVVPTSQDTDRTEQGQHTADPQLYASTEVNSSQAQVPLFAHDDRKDSLGEPIFKVDNRRWLVEPTATPEPQPALKPTDDEYRLVASVFKQMSRPMISNVHRIYQQDPVGYLQKELEYMSRIGGRGSKKNPKTQTEQKRPLKPLAPMPMKVRKIRPVASVSALPVVRKPVSSVKRQLGRRSSDTDTNPALTSATDTRSSRPSVSKASEAQTKPKDVDFNAITDYCPPISTLSLPPYNDDPMCMDVKWTQGPLEPLEDAATSLMHPAEINVARILRLSCAVYLTCKRRLCAEKLRRLQAGIAFTKTHAQSVCRIDVNKTSKIWEAMDKVGWWDTKYYKHLL